MARRCLFMLSFNRRFDNLGDQFIFHATLDALAHFGTVYVRSDFPGDNPNVRTSHSDWRLGAITLANKLRGHSIYYVYPPGGRLWTKPPNTKSPRHWFRRFFDHVVGSRISFGKSVIPEADHSWSRDLDWVGMRDRASLDAIHTAGYHHAGYFPDLAFMPPPLALDDSPRAGVGFSFRGTIPEMRHDQAYETQLSTAVVTLIDSLSAKDRTNACSYEQVEEDAEFSEQISRQTGISHHEQLITLGNYEAFYRPMRIVVSNRLHCLLIGAYCGAVPVLLTSREHTKVISLFETVGWSSLIIPTEKPNEIVDRFRAIQGDLPKHKEMMKNTFAEQRRQGMRILEQLFHGKTLPIGEVPAFATQQSVD